jgi:hypothetical protein
VSAKTVSALLVAALLALAATALDAAEAVSAEPSDPEIVLPPIILEIEDLSVERVEAKLPPEEDLLPPARGMPLVDVLDLVIVDPSVPSTGSAGGAAAAGARDRFVAADVELGAGMMSHLVGRFALKTLGGQPRFSLDFAHETMDGSSADAVAPGFSSRTDDLSGALSFTAGAVDGTFSGFFSETGHGLDGTAFPYLLRLGRSVGGSASVSARPVESLTLGAGLEAGADSFALDGSGLPDQDEYRLAPSLSVDARFKTARLGLSARYGFRGATLAGGTPLHRFTTGLTLEAELAAQLTMNAAVGWFVSSAGANLVPFELRLTGTPLSFLTLSAGGGYRVTPLDMHDALLLDPLVLPDTPQDDSGWFAEGSLRLTFTRDISASARAVFSTASAALDAEATRDPLSGLLPLAQRQGSRLATDFALRWGITQGISLSASLAHEWLPLLVIAPVDRLLVELAALEPAGRWGGNVSVDFTVPQPAVGSAQLPLVSVSGFFAVSDVVTFHLAAADLLAPLAPGGVRMDLGGYETPGLRVTGSLRMSF